jgi:hypothetical protein
VVSKFRNSAFYRPSVLRPNTRENLSQERKNKKKIPATSRKLPDQLKLKALPFIWPLEGVNFLFWQILNIKVLIWL